MSDDVPADQGLSALGLLMQLAGNVLAATAALIGFIALVELDGVEKLWVLLVLGSSVARSLLHRNAGMHLLYGNPGDEGRQRTAGIRRYIVFALFHSVLVPALLAGKYRMTGELVVALAAGLAVWPMVLAALFALPRFRRFQNEVPIAEDKGFEGAAILMTVFGLGGIIASAAGIASSPDTIVALALVMLLVKSALHVQAGLSGLQHTDFDRSIDRANRYANFGVISAFCCGGALLLFVMKVWLPVIGLATTSALCTMLMTWPLAIRRFYSDRQFADLLAGDDAPVHHRAPDAGLTSLGWLLLAHAAGCTTVLLCLLASEWSIGVRSMPLALFAAGLQGAAGLQLVREGRRARAFVIAYAAVAAIASFCIVPHDVAPLLLILPIASVVLVTRKIAPTARARFRAKITT